MGVHYSAELGLGYPVNDEEWLRGLEEEEVSVLEDEEDWWIAQHEVPYIMVYDEDGGHLPGITETDVKVYWEDRKQWLKENPLPVEFMQVGWYEDPMIVVCVKGTTSTCWTDNLKKLDVRDMDMEGDNAYEDLMLVEKFCRKYKIPVDFDAPGWYLGVRIS
jgi:hypothetical protein